MNLKKYIFSIAIAVIALNGCTNDFEEINTNPWTSNNLDVQHLMTFSQLKMYSSGAEAWRGNLIVSGPLAQNTACLYSTGIGFGVDDGHTSPTFDLIYGDVFRNLTDGINRLEAEGGKEGQVAQFEIIRVVNTLRVTQLYGDVPYSEAGKGFSELLYYPKYDTQEEVLTSMVEDLKKARTALEGVNDNNLINYDLYTSGTSGTAKYIKLANSLLMKIGLMMSEADPTKGAEVFKEGFNNAGGYISNWSEAVYVQHVSEGGPWGDHVNGTGIAVEGQVGGFSYPYISEIAMKSMQDNQDPRIFRLVSQFDNSGGVNKAMTDTTQYTNFDPFLKAGDEGFFVKAHYRGVRLGDNGDGNRGVFFNEAKGGAQQAAYWVDQNVPGDAEDDPNHPYWFRNEGQFITIAGLNAATFNQLSPSIVIGADEVQFWIAEANEIPAYGISDAGAFQRGVEFALEKYDAVKFPGEDIRDLYIDLYKRQTNAAYDFATAKTDYVTAAVNRYNSAADKRDVVVYEHWIALTGNGYDSYALWNRTHLPSMVPAVVPAADRNYDLPKYADDPLLDNSQVKNGVQEVPLHRGGVTNWVRPSRFPYPNRELNVNATNSNDAITRQRAGVGESTNFIAIKQWYSNKGN
ncbi:SusD/RagB family nutrient-binding outer membrane lipoprotein [Flammeovirga sp. MY04]|uniref:SusD/RagB family nutrient-binding outer membrane lipoprotein n=1 Tax=Flammeovirga sp. MY04 TaxID=1191459 RepID=UPI00080641A0|nr:SusD/RagB family nutrient-binding outer membrane lipoprotein [Flammeovirga sp. MY04]ANQ47940.1 SusD/RagB family nutrient-binding outer membrane lipoprotein [Flammeovirga sp. MY04]